MNEEWKEIKGISEVLQISMCNNMPLSVNEKRKIFDFIIDLQQKVEQLEKENKELKQPQVFIDCENMEERYGRDLYEDYLKEKIEQLENRIDKAIEYINIEIPLGMSYDEDLLNILQESDKE